MSRQWETQYLELSEPVPMHRVSKSNTTYTCRPTVPIARARLVVQTLNSDDGVSPGLGSITSIKANGRLVVAGSGTGVPITLFESDSRWNPVLELDLKVGEELVVEYSPDAGSQCRMVLVAVPS